MADYTNCSGAKNFSTTEKKIGTWIDGKPVYQKCFEIPCNSCTATTNTKCLVSIGASVDKIVMLRALCTPRNKTTGHTTLLPYTENGSSTTYIWPLAFCNNYSTAADRNKVGFQYCNNIYVNNGVEKVIITLQYTKTTD